MSLHKQIRIDLMRVSSLIQRGNLSNAQKPTEVVNSPESKPQVNQEKYKALVVVK